VGEESDGVAEGPPALVRLGAVDDRGELDAGVVGREGGEEREVVVEAVVVRQRRRVHVRLLGHHLDDRVTDEARTLVLAHVQHREAEVSGREDAVLVPHVERLLQDARVRRRIIPVTVDVLKGSAHKVVAREAHAGGDPPLVQVRVKVVELPVERLLSRRVMAWSRLVCEVAIWPEEAAHAEVEHRVRLSGSSAPDERVGKLAVVRGVVETVEAAVGALQRAVIVEHPVGRGADLGRRDGVVDRRYRGLRGEAARQPERRLR